MFNRWLYRHFKKRFLSEYAKESNKPIELRDLEKTFVTANGTQYYGFPDKVSLPIPREGQLQEFFMHIASGMNPESITEILDEIDGLITEGLTTGKNAAKIGALIHYMRDRVGKVLPSELFYHILAVQYVREDESPQAYNEQIQLEKVAEFKQEMETNSSFFLHTNELKRLRNLLQTSDEQLQTYLRLSEAIDLTVMKDLKKALSSSTTPLSSEEATATN